jgi:hypothetical protein
VQSRNVFVLLSNLRCHGIRARTGTAIDMTSTTQSICLMRLTTSEDQGYFGRLHEGTVDKLLANSAAFDHVYGFIQPQQCQVPRPLARRCQTSRTLPGPWQRPGSAFHVETESASRSSWNAILVATATCAVR